jgi:prepilin-type N-terminal cleavage/methylation domain-containing protein
MRRRGFTLLEVLVVVGIIAILASLLVLGVSHIMGGSKKNATQVTLQALQGMLGEFDAKTRLSKQPQGWGWWSTNSSVGVTPGPGFDFWRTPFTDPSLPSYRKPYDSMDAPGSVLEGNYLPDKPWDSDPSEIVRNGSRQVLNTAAVMNLLLAIPSNRSALEKIASDRYFIPKWVSRRTLSPQAPLGPGTDGTPLTSDDASTSEDIGYQQGIRVQAKAGRLVCVQGHVASPSLPVPGTNWAMHGTTRSFSFPPLACVSDCSTARTNLPARIRRRTRSSSRPRARS